MTSGCVTVPSARPESALPDKIVKPWDNTTLTVEQAVTTALSNNPDIRASYYQIQRKHFETYQASKIKNPSINFSIDPTAWTLSLIGSISSMMNIGDKRQKRVDVAHMREQQAVLVLEQQRIDLAKDVRQIYDAVY